MDTLTEQLGEYTVEELSSILGLYLLKMDYQEYAAQCLRVPPEEGGALIPFTFNKPQRTLHKIIQIIKSQNRLIRLWVLKSRRQGISTYFAGWAYQLTAFTPNRYTMQVANRPQTADFLFRMVKRFYVNTPDDARPQIRANNSRMLEFNNEDGTGLDSAFRIATAGVEEIGTGQAVHFAHFSEIAYYGSNAKAILDNALPAVPETDLDSVMVGESTANGVGGEFHARFWAARYRYWVSRLDDDGEPVIVESVNPDADESNNEISVFLPWFVHDKNRMDPPKDFLPAEEEQKIKETYNLSDEQIYWRRHTIHNKFKGNVYDFNQAHPDTPENAFISSGSPFFNNPKVLQLKKACAKPKARYWYNDATRQFESNPDGQLSVWEESRPGQHYVIGADCGEGLADGDFHSADVVNHRTGEQVAHWHGKCAGREYGRLLCTLGKRYNDAYLAPERNNSGVTVVDEIYEQHYPNLHVEMIPEPPGKPRPRYGWVTSGANRLGVLSDLKEEVNLGVDGIRCEDTYGEMLTFQRTKEGRYEAQDGCFDDRVMSYAIAKEVRRTQPLPALALASHIKQTRTTSAGGGLSRWGGVK